MQAEEIRKGIAPYQHETAVLRRVLRKYGELSADAFDRIFGDFKYTLQKDGLTGVSRRRPKVRFCLYTPDAFILGGFMQGEWAKWLDLLQMMCRCGEAETVTRDGNLFYRLKQ